jgi:hypothetical protein
VPKNNLQILALDQNFLKAWNTIIRTFYQMPKSVGSFLALDRIINKSFDQLTTFKAFDRTHY